jgi:hypothetical protein
LAKPGGGLPDGLFAIRDDPSRLGLMDGLGHLGDQGLELSPQRLFQLPR